MSLITSCIRFFNYNFECPSHSFISISKCSVKVKVPTFIFFSLEIEKLFLNNMEFLLKESFPNDISFSSQFTRNV